MVLADCQPASGPEKDRAQLRVVQGLALLNLKRAAEAKPEFEAALAADPANLDALLGLASATFATDGRQAVQPVLERAPEELKKRSRYWMAVGGLEMDAGDFAAAEQSFQKALDRASESKKGPERVSALAALAEAQMRQGRLEDARATTAQLSKAAPKNLQVKQLTAQVEAAAGNLDEARSLLEEVVNKQPGNYQAKTLLGMVNLQQGNIGQAEVQFAEVVAEQPNNVQAQKLLAEARGRVQTPAATLASLKASLDPATADAEMLSMAGRLSLEAGDQKQAMSYFSQAAAQMGPDTLPATQLEIASGFLRAGETRPRHPDSRGNAARHRRRLPARVPADARAAAQGRDGPRAGRGRCTRRARGRRPGGSQPGRSGSRRRRRSGRGPRPVRGGAEAQAR